MSRRADEPPGSRLQILLSGYRSSLPKMWRGPDWPERGWPSQLTNDQSDFFPGHPSFNYCGERPRWTGIRYSDTQILSLLVSTTIMWAHIQRIFNQARKMNRKKYKLETPSIMSCPKWVLTLQIEMLITRSDTELNISGRAGDCDELDPFYNPYKGDNSIWCWHTTTHNTITSINRGLNLRQQSSHNAQTPISRCQSVSPISVLSSHLVESHKGLHWPQTTCSSCLRAESQESCDPWPGN